MESAGVLWKSDFDPKELLRLDFAPSIDCFGDDGLGESDNLRLPFNLFRRMDGSPSRGDFHPSNFCAEGCVFDFDFNEPASLGLLPSPDAISGACSCSRSFELGRIGEKGAVSKVLSVWRLLLPDLTGEAGGVSKNSSSVRIRLLNLTGETGGASTESRRMTGCRLPDLTGETEEECKLSPSTRYRLPLSIED